MPKWESYEQVGTCLLDQFAAEFGLNRVEAKQEVPGQRSGTSWEIDAKGVRHGNDVFLIVEFRRYTTSRQSQEKMGGVGLQDYRHRSGGWYHRQPSRSARGCR